MKPKYVTAAAVVAISPAGRFCLGVQQLKQRLEMQFHSWFGSISWLASSIC
ncbi:hypothetical protein [Ruegeria atlantica]|uniref:hypothetical protein n=1 Tax=Ruegeria atlantica TaxID=81569 RepID=UPI00147D49F2|nr:hypothetical protein [Ruegeria atlantica]